VRSENNRYCSDDAVFVLL